jgi:uncharacterized protein
VIIVKTFKTPNGYYVYDRETNTILNVTKKEFVLLKEIELKDIPNDDCQKVISVYQEKGYFKESVLEEIEHPETKSLYYYLNKRIQKLTLQLTQNCNLRCDYCAYSGKYDQRTHSSNKMSFQVIKDTVDFAMQKSKGIRTLNIGFYGGEPLLEFENIKKTVAYINEKYNGRNVTYSLTTNGTLFNDELVRFFKENNISILISIDGPKEMHDKNRVFASGKGSFELIMKNLKWIKSTYPDFFEKISFNTVIPPGSSYKCVNDFFCANELFEGHNLNKSTVSGWNNKDRIVYDDKYFTTYNYEYLKILLSSIGKISKDRTSKFFFIGSFTR